MRVTLMHNPKAGHDSPSDDDLIELLKQAEYKVEYQSTKKKKWKDALEEPGDLVVAAGGDGTIAKVATEMAGRDIPVAILPVGTANNIATSLGIGGRLEEIVAGWDIARRRRIDIGTATGPWGTRRFLEAVGFGLFTQSMALVESREEAEEPGDRDEELERDLRFLRMTLDAARSHHRHISLDGEDLSGDYFLAEVMNIRCIGPNLCLAPNADTGDGMLDVVLLGEHDRRRFQEYLDRHLDDRQVLPHLPVHTGRVVRFRWDGLPIHVDDHIYADPSMSDRSDDDAAMIEIRLDSSVELLLGSG
jgi:diacylglycerol kinase (ATP)